MQEVSCGVPFLLVPVATRAAVDAPSPDAGASRGLCRAAGRPERPMFLFSTPRPDDDATVYSRMFAPGLGIAEDPATGSAGGPLGCYLVRHGVVPSAQAGAILNLQGVAWDVRAGC